MGPEQLYLLPPEEFTAARDDAAKAARAAGHADRAKQLKALRRPSVAAWLVNGLVAAQPGLVEQLLALGPALARAQAQGKGEELRTLGAQRRELIGGVVRQAVELAGRDVTAAVRDEVAATLETALADPGAAEAVRSGRLVRALSYAGFGGVDLDGAVASPSVTSRPKQPAKAKDDDRIAAAETAALEAAGRLDDAVRGCEQAQREQATAAEAAQAAHALVDDLAGQLERARRAAAQAESRRASAQEAAETAVATVRTRQAAEEKARSELDRLRRA